MTKQQYLEKRNKLATDARALHELSEKEERGFTPEERERYDKYTTDIDTLDETWKRREKQDAIEAEARRIAGTAPTPDNKPADPTAVSTSKRTAFRAYVAEGIAGLDEEQRAAAAAAWSQVPAEVRSLSGQTGSAGAFLIQGGDLQPLEEALKWYGGILNAADVIVTESGAPLPWPTVNDTTNKGRRVSESGPVQQKDPTFAMIPLNAYPYTSDLVLVPWVLGQDTAFPIEAYLGGAFGERLGRILNEEMTTGTGQGMPLGLVPAIGSNGVSAASATAIAYADFVDLEHSVDIAYRVQKGAGWMFHDLICKAAKKLVDSTGRPLWLPGLMGIAGGFPDTLLNYPFFINNDMDSTMASTKVTVLFGAFKKYKVRQVRGIFMVRLTERYAETLSNGFFAYGRWDGQLIDAGTKPIKRLVH